MSGPGTATFENSKSAITQISNLAVGRYKFRLTATDNLGKTATDDVYIQVTSINTGNISPVANAGTDQTIMLPTSSVSLTGSGTDTDGTIASYTWTKIAGGAATITTPASPSTMVTGLTQGVYTFRLTVTDNGGAAGYDDVNVTVNASTMGSTPYNGPHNIPGIIEAEDFDNGGEGVAYHDTDTINQTGKYRTGEAVDIETVADSTGSYDVGWIAAGEWEKYTVYVQTASTYTFTARISTPNSGKSFDVDVDGTVVATVAVPQTGTWQTWQTTSASNISLTAGTHTIKLIFTTGGINVNYVTFTGVTPANQSPIANAGVDQTITLPTNSTMLSGYGTDIDGGITAYAWTKIAGGAVTIASPTSAATGIIGLSAGTYTFQLTVTDNAGATAYDDVVITVNAAPVAPSGPYGGSAWTIPGTIQAEDFDLGGEGVGYHDLFDSVNQGGQYRPTELVDIETSKDTSGAYDVGWIYPGEWLAYTVDIQATGLYTLNARVSAPSGVSGFTVTVDGVAVATVPVPTTGTYQTWQTVSVPNISLTQGGHTLKLTALSSGFNINYVSFIAGATVNIPPTANAGVDQTITLPTNSTTLVGSGADTDGAITSYAWTKTAGGAVTITSPTNASTGITGLSAGTYTFRLTVTDNAGATAYDEVSVIVNDSTGCITPGTTNLPPDAGMPEYDMILNPNETSATITAKPTDPECQGIATYSWKVSPTPGSVSGYGTPTLTISGLQTGKHYGVSLVVKDKGLPSNPGAAMYSPSEGVVVMVAKSVTPSEAASGLTLQAIRNNEVKNMVTAPLQQPPISHPRLYGSDQIFEQQVAPLDQLSCSTLTDSTLGSYINLKNLWDMASKGYAPCKTTKPSIATNTIAAPYYATTPPAWNELRAKNAMFLLRRLMACYDQGRTDCLYSKADYEDFRTRFINYEMNEFRTNWIYGPANATKCCRWTYGFAIYDIYSGDPFRHWSMFLDLAWNYLTPDDRKVIQDEMSFRIDGWLDQVRQRHWSYANGNNWNGNESQGLVAWAITNWYEDPVRAKKVLTTVIDALWLHRDSYLDSGYYSEGSSYVGVSLNPILNSVRMVTAAFGETFHSMKWDYFPKLTDYYLDNFSPDGHSIDFGDAHLETGWSDANPLTVNLLEELFGKKNVGTTSIDPCIVRNYFQNKYFGRGFDEAWMIHPVLARDWATIGSQCTATRPSYGTQKVTIDTEGGQTALRTYLTGTTQAAKLSPMRFEQADETYLNASSTPSSFPHRELDFGALIWAVHGSRLLWDMGYGNILSQGTKTSARPNGDLYDLTKNLDFLPFSSNTVYIPDAKDTDSSGAPIPNTDRSQFYLDDGTTTPITVSGIKGALLDGSVPYGSQETLGWMKKFNRILLPIWDGHFLVIDSIRLKDGRASRVAENFYTYLPSLDDMAITGCNYDRQFSVSVTIPAANIAMFTPRCMDLTKNVAAEGQGSIVGTSVASGQMHLDPNVYQLSTATNAERRVRVYWDSNSAITKDLRIFALVAGTIQSGVPAASVTPTTCTSGYICFKVSIGGQSKTLRFSETADGYTLEAFE